MPEIQDRNKRIAHLLIDPETPLAVNERQAAALLGRSVQTLRNWRQDRRGLPYVKQGRSVSYLVADIQSFLQANRIDPEATR
jgi:phage terminase Nu1 subunit (DNA packaging protein)